MMTRQTGEENINNRTTSEIKTDKDELQDNNEKEQREKRKLEKYEREENMNERENIREK